MTRDVAQLHWRARAVHACAGVLLATLVATRALPLAAKPPLAPAPVEVPMPAEAPEVRGWPPAPADAFRADVYPSAAAADRAMADEVVALVRRVNGEAAPEHVEVDVPAAQDEAFAAVQQRVSVEFGSARFTKRDDAPPVRAGGLPRGTVRVQLRAESWEARARWARPSSPLRRGTLEVRAVGPNGDQRLRLAYLDKPWAEDFGAFLSAGPARPWVRGEAPRPGVSEADALRLARADAAGELVPRVVHEGRLDLSAGAGSEADLAKFIADSLAREPWLADQFVRRLSRPYGDVYHASVLVDASPSAMQSLAREWQSSRSAVVLARVERTVTTWGAVAALAGVLFVLYLLVNAFTRGYFAGRLRAVAVVAAGVGLVAVLLLLG